MSNRGKRGENALQTFEIHGKARRQASCRLSKTKRDRSRSVEQLRSSFFLESIGFFFLVTSSIESKAIRVAITTENGSSLRDTGPRPQIDCKSERFSLIWWTSNERYGSSSRRILTNKVYPFRLGKDLSIGIFLLKIRAKMTPQRRFKAVDDYPSKFHWPGIQGLIMNAYSECTCTNYMLLGILWNFNGKKQEKFPTDRLRVSRPLQCCSSHSFLTFQFHAVVWCNWYSTSTPSAALD